jgi:hypothetical protein
VTHSSAFIAAIRGPIVMITLGLLFAVDRLGGYDFSRTWPVLIIVFGILTLFERSSRSARSAPYSDLS